MSLSSSPYIYSRKPFFTSSLTHRSYGHYGAFLQQLYPHQNGPAQTPPTDYSAFILDVLRHTIPQPQPSSPSAAPAPLINQSVLRQCLGLASSFLITDLTTSPEKGLSTWLTGFSRLVDLVVALHARGELEVATISEASKACSECWTAAGAWKGMEDCREGVRSNAGKLKKLLDEGGKTYRGERVYAP